MLENVSVIGAAGKMGRGIALVLLQYMSLKKFEDANASIELHLIDKQSLDSLRPYLREHLRIFGEKNINRLREFSAFVSNEEVIQAFIETGMDCVRLGKEPQETEETFEAIDEDIQAKIQLMHELNGVIFTNTSSIPIHILSEKANKRVIGFHFYNPPQVQPIVELVALTSVDRELGMNVVKALEKIAVEPNDVAGFIGNGEFMREVDFACRLVEELAKERSFYQSLYMVDTITKDFLIRPMGIFQLIDYVGVETCLKIGKIMSLVPSLLTKIPKEGCFEYSSHTPTQVYDVEQRRYHHFSEGNWMAECSAELSPLPHGHLPWKVVSKLPNRKEWVETYLKTLFSEKTLGALLAQNYLDETRRIADLLVKDGVAKNHEDIKKVMMLGFHHLYGPDLRG